MSRNQEPKESHIQHSADDLLQGERIDSLTAVMGDLGDRWSLLVLREAFFGVRRFVDFQRNLGISRTQLSTQLTELVDRDLLTRQMYQTRPERYEYRLTDKGLDLFTVIVALLHWGDRWLLDKPLLRLEHHECGGPVEVDLRCTKCDEPVDARTTRYRKASKKRKPKR
jgi:DNA-binding HxlR family transcriptional regulator